jgi:hypothetical protein
MPQVEGAATEAAHAATERFNAGETIIGHVANSPIDHPLIQPADDRRDRFVDHQARADAVDRRRGDAHVRDQCSCVATLAMVRWSRRVR